MKGWFRESMDYYVYLNEMIRDFEYIIKYKKRFRIEHGFLDEIKKYSVQCSVPLPAKTIFYRARICDEDFIRKKELETLRYCRYNCAYCYKDYTNKRDTSRFSLPFAGYDEIGSFVPSNNEIISDGRLNPCYIPVLYVAEDKDTALYEVRPNTNSFVNLAEIELLRQINLFDISLPRECTGSDFITFKRTLSVLFSRIINNPKEYMITQYISEFIHDLGFDGIRFNSSLKFDGINLGIFDIDACKAISSDLFEVTQIKYDYRALFRD